MFPAIKRDLIKFFPLRNNDLGRFCQIACQALLFLWILCAFGDRWVLRCICVSLPQFLSPSARVCWLLNETFPSALKEEWRCDWMWLWRSHRCLQGASRARTSPLSLCSESWLFPSRSWFPQLCLDCLPSVASACVPSPRSLLCFFPSDMRPLEGRLPGHLLCLSSADHFFLQFIYVLTPASKSFTGGLVYLVTALWNVL